MMFLSRVIQKKVAEKGRCLVSIVGAGGKTTTLYALANELKKEYPVVITTTTAMMAPQVEEVSFIEFSKEIVRRPSIGEMCAWYDRPDPDVVGKVRGVLPQAIDELMQDARGLVVLNEADGAARKPLKAPADHEPVVPDSTDIVLVVIGLDALFKPAGCTLVHREALYYERTNSAQGDMVTPSSIVLLMHHPKGLLKNIPHKAEVYVVLNKLSSFDGVMHLSEFARALPKRVLAVVVSEMANVEEAVVIRREP